MAECTDARGTGGNKVYVIAHENDQDVVQHFKIETHLGKEGLEPSFSYDMDPRVRIPSELDERMGSGSKFIHVVSEHSLADPWIQHTRKVVGTTRPIQLILDKNIDISQLPVEIKVFPCITVRNPDWIQKLISYLIKPKVEGCPPLGRIAPGLCCGYVNGYATEVLNGFVKALKAWQTEYGTEEGSRIVLKMINLIPESCNCSTILEDYDPVNIRKEAVMNCRRDYLDTKKRNFDMPIYRVQNPGDPKEVYYVVLAQNATIHTLYEMSLQVPSSLDYDSMMKERSLFETQLVDMLKGKPFEVLTFDKKVDLAQRIVEKCRQIVGEDNTVNTH